MASRESSHWDQVHPSPKVYRSGVHRPGVWEIHGDVQPLANGIVPMTALGEP
jgi:hypothetical protein